jgi:hypothetical protein
MGLREAPTMSALALDLVPPIVLGLREGDGAMADNGRQHTVGRRLRLSRWRPPLHQDGSAGNNIPVGGARWQWRRALRAGHRRTRVLPALGFGAARWEERSRIRGQCGGGTRHRGRGGGGGRCGAGGGQSAVRRTSMGEGSHFPPFWI